MERQSNQPIIRVDVTSHKEICTPSDNNSTNNFFVRYYIEVVLGESYESQTRIGFSGTFKDLKYLHREFQAISRTSDDIESNQDGQCTSLSSSQSERMTITSSKSSLSKFLTQFKGSKPFNDASTLSIRSMKSSDRCEPFPTSTKEKILLKFESKEKEAKNDAKIAERCEALFEYYRKLFNTPVDGMMYWEFLLSQATKTSNTSLSTEDMGRKKITLEFTSPVRIRKGRRTQKI